MKVLIDADGCPVVDIACRIAKENNIECIILCDTSHTFEKDGARTIIVSKGADSVDFALVNMIEENDAVITQDYGLAAMCLAKFAHVLNQDGKIYTDENIQGLLYTRYTAKKIRNAGGRFSQQPKRKEEQNENFKSTFLKILGIN